MRKPIPLTRVYKRTPCGRALYGVVCPPDACDGTCSVTAVLLALYALADSPWVRATDARRDDSSEHATLAAAALAIAFGIEQPTVLPLAVKLLRQTTPVAVLERVRSMLGIGVPSGCVVVHGAAEPVAGHEPWATVYRSPDTAHYGVCVRAGPRAWMQIDLATTHALGCDTTRVAAPPDHGCVLVFHYNTSQYKP
jgi:hypothetical protein